MQERITLSAEEAEEVIDLMLETADHIEFGDELSKDFIGILRTAFLDDRLHPDE